MKRLLVAWVALEAAIALAGCGSNEAQPPPAMPVVHMPWVPRRLGGNAKPKTSAALADVTSDAAIDDESDADDSIVVDAATDTASAAPVGPLSGVLRSKTLHNPMPGGVFGGYAGDTGLDLMGSPRTVHAIADARVDYAEAGHTRWTGPKDSPYCVRLSLDEPIAWKGHKITHVYYAHLSALAFEQKEGVKSPRHVAGGEALGTSGSARGVAHLHLGLLLDGEVEQDDWAFILREGEVRAVLGNYNNGEVLPKS